MHLSIIYIYNLCLLLFKESLSKVEFILAEDVQGVLQFHSLSARGRQAHRL